jgi:hypothetical protein
MEHTSHGIINRTATNAEDSLSVFDAGSVFAGELLTHSFEFVNSLSDHLEITNPADITKKCGCLLIEPASNNLAPGARTSVRVQINTAGLDGPVNKGGTITWSSKAGRKITWPLSIRAVIVQPFTNESGRLSFTSTDIDQKRSKKLKIRGSPGPAIDWSSAQFHSSSPDFIILNQSVSANSCQCSIVCCPRDAGEYGEGQVWVRADAVRPQMAKEPAVLSSPFQVDFRRIVPFAVKPTTPLFLFDTTTATATARLLLSGQQLAGQRPIIESIVSDGFIVKWKESCVTYASTAV